MKELAFKCWVRSQMVKQKIRDEAKNLYSEECGGTESIIIAVILIIIVIALAIIFRTEIEKFVKGLFSKAEEDAAAGGFTKS